ncbi:MAG: hypothetical protein ABSC19_04975 [Syntrophorhabdales bacterium]|jgi:hypothetical protein
MADEIVHSATQAVDPGSGPGEESAPSTTEPEVPSSAATQEAGSSPATPDGNIDGQGAKPPEAERSKDAASRIQQLVAQREYWKGVAEGRIRDVRPEARPPAAVPGAPVPPEPTGFSRWEDYEQAKARYAVDKAKFELRTEIAVHQARETIAKTDRAFRERMEKAAEADPELMTMAHDPTLRISLPMALAIRESAAAPELLRHLGENREEAARIASLPPLAAAKEMGRIEARFLRPERREDQPRTVSQAPEPARVVGGTRGNIEPDLDKIPIEDFMSRRNEAQYGGKRRA